MARLGVIKVMKLLALLLSAVIFSAPVAGQTALSTVRAGAFDWSGLYAGVAAGGSRGGYEFRSHSVSTVPPAGSLAPSFLVTIPSLDTSRSTRPLGGAQVGYNTWFGTVLAGAEVEFDARTVKASVDSITPIPFPLFVDPAAVVLRQEATSRWIASARLRAGLPWGRELLYLTGGLALADVEMSSRGTYGVSLATPVLQANALSANPFTQRRTETGWTAGLGFEHAIRDSLSVGVEYLRSDFGARTFRLGSHPSGDSRILPSPVRTKFATDDVALKINFRFGR